MIKWDFKDIKSIRWQGKLIKSVINGGKQVWTALLSCFGRGYWINDLPWVNTDAWKNNDN